MDFLRWLRWSLGGGTPPPRAPDARPPNDLENESIAALFRGAVTRHAQGDVDGAEAVYRTILENDPDFVPALHLLGRIHAQRGKLRRAAAFLERARSVSSDDADILADLAEVRRLEGSPGDARSLLETAISLEPARAALHYALAGLHLQGGEIEAGIARLEGTVSLDDAHADAQNDLGAAYLETGRYDDARRSLESAARTCPTSPLAYRNLANLFLRVGEVDRSVHHFREALERAPEDRELRRQFAEALLRFGDPVAALEEYRSLAESDLGDAPAWKRLAETAAKIDRRTDAIDWYRRALDADPRQPDVLNNLGILLSGAGRYEEAAEHFEHAVRIQPDFDRGFDNLGGAYHLQGRYGEAVDAYKKALEIDPLNSVTLSNLIAITNYRRQGDPGFVEELHASYLRSLAPERARAVLAQGGGPAAGRPLRIGYVSPDFRSHSVAFFIEPLIEGHDRGRFQVYCYSDVARPDAVTERLKGLADCWRDVRLDSDEVLATRIREDEIDLLVDLGGHFAGNRLPVFAQKPAPIQIAYLGYPATTGLPEVTHRLSDGIADPPGEADALYSETLLRLPEVFLCYRPPDAAPAPAEVNGPQEAVTFGSFNELPKLSPELIQCWCRILGQVPGSKLLLKATALKDPDTRKRVIHRFEVAGVSPDRLELLGRTATLAEHLALYAGVDVALDTFPYNGTTTTCEAIYMGVPVVTLPGTAHAGRVGASLLGVLDLPGLIADSEDEYVGKAVALAADHAQRQTYRRSLRDRMRASTLCDARAFVEAVERRYLQRRERWLGSLARRHERVASPIEVAGSVEIQLRDGGRMVLPGDADQLTAYVLLEQEDWFEDETGFLRGFLSPGMRVLDVGASFGVYTRLAARCVGARGRVFSVEPSSATARWLRANVVVNALENVDVFELALSDQSGERRLSLQPGAECNRLMGDTSPFERGDMVEVSRLDEFAHRFGIESADFVKLDAEGAEKQIIDGGRRFFEQESPLVMFEIKSAIEVDLDLARKFSDLGYRPLRLVPGLDLLATVDLTQPPDSYALNLFACKDDRRTELADRGLVAVEGAGDSSPAWARDQEVWDYFLSRAYSRSRVGYWKARSNSPGANSEKCWMRMLGHYVAAADSGAAPSSRLSSLQAAFEIVSTADFQMNPAAHLNSLARIAWALGYRSRAVEALTTLTGLGGDDAGAFDLPFLPASPHFDAIEPGDRPGAWCVACARDQFECLRSFSSYFLGEQNLLSLERLNGSAFQRPEMERRRLLVRWRQGLPLNDVSAAVRVRSPDNCNPAFWLRLLERG